MCDLSEYCVRSASDGEYHFDAVIILQFHLAVSATRHDFPVDLDRHSAFGKPHFLQQGRDGDRARQRLFLSVQNDLHGMRADGDNGLKIDTMIGLF
jgi:hypothetical protein